MIPADLDRELDEAIDSMRSAHTVGELVMAMNWIKKLLQRMFDECAR